MTVVDATLHTSLRTLKLSGMLETLDARLVQAHAGELGHRVGAPPPHRQARHRPGGDVHGVEDHAVAMPQVRLGDPAQHDREHEQRPVSQPAGGQAAARRRVAE